ncbi:MAG: hypothetical protein AAF433_15690 [Bacteroidota bacterium]
MSKNNSTSHKMRVWHRYLGFTLAGVMAVYAISGIVLIFRKGDTFKRPVTTEKTVAAHLNAAQLGDALDIRDFQATRTEGDIIYFDDGTYNPATGVASITKMRLPFVLDKLTHLHKSTTKDPLFFFNILFGLSLLFFVISAFWMYMPGTDILKKGLWFTAGGVVLVLVMLFV